MAPASTRDFEVAIGALTPDVLDAAKVFVRSKNIAAYLPPREPVEELLDLALVKDSRSVVFTWTQSNDLFGLIGLVIYPDSAEAELWCMTLDEPKHYGIVRTAAEHLAAHAFTDLNLSVVRTRCGRTDQLAINALRDAGLFEEGAQRGAAGGEKAPRDHALFGVLRSEWNPDSLKRDNLLIATFRWEDRYPFVIALVLQVAILAALAYLAVVAAGWFALVLALILEAVVLYYDRRLFLRIRDEHRIGPRILGPGLILSLVFSAVFLLSAFYRVRWSAGFTASWVAVLFLLVTVGLMQAGAFSKCLRGRVPWFWVTSAMMAVPMIFVWIPLSDSASQWTMTPGYLQGIENWREKTKERAQTVAERRAWAADSAPAAPRVAVALSGGGYRAALIHSGVLAALDRNRIPLRYLTTVSGGSIIGAYYALGYRPEEFIRATWQQKPGLALNKLNFFQSLSSWLVPWASDADVYADHFAHFYFGRATLHDLPDTPVLIVNATDIEASPQDAREIFSREIAELSPKLAESTRVADVVAASGSFPVAFEPKAVRWLASGTDLHRPAVVRRKFIDGGVLENLGLEGLKRYLHMRLSLNLELNKPDVLIVSDASLSSGAEALAAKPELTSLLARVQNISYSAFGRSLLNQFTGKGDYERWMAETPFSSQFAEVPYANIDPALAAGEPQVLKVVVIPSTSPQMEVVLRRIPSGTCSFHGRAIADVQREVAAFATLEELSPADVEKAAWLGSALVSLYSGAIRCSLDKSRDPGMVCSVPKSAEACPTFEQIVPDVSRH